VSTDALPDNIRPFDDAQRRAISLLGDVSRRLEVGMKPADVARIAEERAPDHGFNGWYHAPEVAIGRGIAGGLRAGLRPEALAHGSLVSIDLGPADGTAFGDIGATLCFGGTAPKVLDVARECVRACCGYASRWKTVGEVQVFARAWAVNHRMELGSEDAVGHRVLTRADVPGADLLGSNWPSAAHALNRLPRNRIHRLHPVRMAGMFAVRPVVRSADGAAASFEEIVFVRDDVRRVLGREGLAEIGGF
jgi:hypothetical protein